MTSTEEQNEENYLPHRHMEMDVLMQEICQSIGNFTLTSEAPDGEMQQQQDEDTDIEDVTMVCSSRNIVLLEGNFTNTETLKNTPFINDKTLFGESNSCQCNEMECSGNIISEVPEYVSVTSTATTMCERKGPLDTCKDAYARVKGQECLRDHKLEEVNYKINEVKTHRESQTHNKHYLSNYLGNEYSSMTEQPAFNTNVNRQQETNKTDVRNSCTSIENIPEQVKSTLQSHSARVDYSIRNKTEISEPNQETLEGALKVLANTVGVTKAPDADTQHQIMIGNDLRDKSSLVLPCDSKLAHENIHVTFQPLKKMVANDDFTAGSVGNILPKTENSDNEFQFHGGSEHADTERTIFHQQITYRNRNSITTSRRLKASPEAANSLLSLNSSNENHATDESEYHKENENSPNMVRSLKRPKVICRVLPLEVMSHVKREISPSALSNTNTDFKKISSVLQCTSNKNNISCVEEWTITERHPMVQHSSHVGRVTNSVPQVTSDRPPSRAISLPQPDVITTDTDILRPLVAQEIDPEVRLAETGSDNELSNKADMYVDNITINLSENIFCVKNKTECLKRPLLVRNSTETSFKNLHEVSATACYRDDACKIKDNYLTKQETEAEIPEMSNANSTNLVTAKSSMGSIYAGDDYEIVHPADYSVKKGMEFKLSDKIQNCATVTESNATKCYIRVVLMKHRPNVQHLPTFDYIDGFPTPMRLTRKKVNWDKKLIKQKDVTVQRERFERSVALNSIKYPTFCKSDVSHWSTNRRRASVRKSGTANERKQASDKTVSRNESHSEVIPFRNQWKFPSHDTCNENAVAQWRIYGNDLVGTQNVRNKLLMYDSINITKQKLTKVSDSVTRVKFEGKFSICGNQKGTDQYDDGDDEVTSSYKFHNDEVTEHNIKSPAGINPNFVHRTSLISLQNMTLHMLSNIIFDHEVHLNCKTVNILFETGQQKEQLANNTINKQLQTLNGDGTNTAPSEIDNCNLNKMGAVKLQRSENKTYRAVLVYITDDGYIIPEPQKKLSIASQNTPINNKNSQAESKNRAELFVEQNTDMQYITEKSVPNQHDDNPTVQQLICNQETEKCAQRRMSKEDARTERKLRFQRAKLFFQKHEQNKLDKPHI
ncbi:hypothetical protein L798_05734 [Zootermopsis nevadensis]|uniref:Uncharacterized protein n=1 Tax=Zootermopsis nevadensis TaxID=136037 RepID=A0A067RAY5_ZOONE|nr:hypothetical protein L798_05734 [Zootermopsis nevadensis]